MPKDLTPFSGLHEDREQLPISLVAIDLPSIAIYAVTGDTPVYVNLSNATTRTTPADGYTPFVPYGGLKVPTLKSMDSIQIDLSNADDFWGGVNAAGDYSGSTVTIWQGQVDTADQADPDVFTFSGVVSFYEGELVNVIRASDVASLKINPHPNANTIHLPRERYDRVRYRRCPPPGFEISFGFTTRTL